MAEPIRFEVTAGLPFSRRVRVVDGKNIWVNLEDFEARMQIRVEENPLSTLKFDFTEYLEKSYEANDIIIEWHLSGAQTRELKYGYYDLILSDVGVDDVRAIKILYGYLRVLSTITTA